MTRRQTALIVAVAVAQLLLAGGLLGLGLRGEDTRDRVGATERQGRETQRRVHRIERGLPDRFRVSQRETGAQNGADERAGGVDTGGGNPPSGPSGPGEPGGGTPESPPGTPPGSPPSSPPVNPPPSNPPPPRPNQGPVGQIVDGVGQAVDGVGNAADQAVCNLTPQICR